MDPSSEEQSDNEVVYREWCIVWMRDPEDTASMVLFEEHCQAWIDKNTQLQFPVESWMDGA